MPGHVVEQGRDVLARERVHPLHQRGQRALDDEVLADIRHVVDVVVGTQAVDEEHLAQDEGVGGVGRVHPSRLHRRDSDDRVARNSVGGGGLLPGLILGSMMGRHYGASRRRKPPSVARKPPAVSSDIGAR